jgi:hypothetical protein
MTKALGHDRLEVESLHRVEEIPTRPLPVLPTLPFDRGKRRTSPLVRLAKHPTKRVERASVGKDRERRGIGTNRAE